MVLRPLVAGALAQIQTQDLLVLTVSTECVNLRLLQQIETTLDICLENTVYQSTQIIYFVIISYLTFI